MEEFDRSFAPISHAASTRAGRDLRRDLGSKKFSQSAQRGEQIIRIVLDQPRPLRRIKLEFTEMDVERTQEFTLRWS
ncbi:MAG: hypothetical protein ACLQU2_19075, partial [Candidatus Binataceae bacterium]